MILIKNAEVLTGTGENLKKGCIIIDGKKIAKVFGISGVEERDFGEDVIVIDGEGLIATPGFIDAHTHLGLWEDAIEFEGADGNEATDPITPELRAIDGINPMDRTFSDAYENGITTVTSGPGSANVIGGQFTVIKTCGKRIDDMILLSPSAMKCAFGENPKTVYNEQHKAPMTRMATASLLRETLMGAREYLKNKEDEDEDKHPDFDLQMESLLPVLKKEIPLKAHAHRADDIFTAMRIAKEFDVNMTLDHCTEGHLIAEYIKESGFPALVGPSFGDRSKFELKNMTFETPAVLHQAGVKIAIITDHPVVPIQYLPLCAALAVKAGLDKEEALKAITKNPAEILGVGARVGTLEEGKDADVVLWSDHPFELQSNVMMTIIDGKIVYKR